MSLHVLHIICRLQLFFTLWNQQNAHQDSSNSQTKDEPNNLIIAYYIEALHKPVNSPRDLRAQSQSAHYRAVRARTETKKHHTNHRQPAEPGLWTVN